MFARIVNLALLVALVIAIPLSHKALSQKKGKGPAPKVEICHFPDDSAVGHVIEVSENAVPAHVSKHGDCTEFLARPNGACRCLTCEELCQRDFRRCNAAGGTPERCQQMLRRCLAGCDGNVIGGG